MPDKFFYSIWTLIFCTIWFVLFVRRKDLKQEMLFISILFGFGGLISETTHVQDWWQPITLTNTKIGIEDFLIGFFIGGVAATIYEELYGKKLGKASVARQNLAPRHFLIAFGLIFLSLFYIFKFSSAYAVLVAYSVCITYMLFKRKDLALDSVVSGFLMLLIGSIIYYILFFIDPDYFQKYWFLRDNWYSHLYLNIPLAEYIWYFLTGMFIGPLYIFVKGIRLTKFKN